MALRDLEEKEELKRGGPRKFRLLGLADAPRAGIYVSPFIRGEPADTYHL